MACAHSPLDPSLPVDGAELFARTWVVGDPRAAGGDGLGPSFNASSCASCHAQGGLGGSGGDHADVRVVRDRDGLARVDHRFGTTVEGLPGVMRNTPALFGAGLVARISVADRVAAARHVRNFAVSGRIPPDPEGGAGLFGWKGQTATLRDFVATACAIELGLENPDAHQPGPEAPGLDMDEETLDALVDFVADLPRPVELEVPGADRGREVFLRVGCGDCHVPDVGGVRGLYSDLMVHDFGRDASDLVGDYYREQPDLAGAATATEWRTPPLWGLRDSAPYLHDGRADTVETAIRLHDGEAHESRLSWEVLLPEDRRALDAFLQSLVAPQG